MRSPSMWSNRTHCWINLQKRKTTLCTNIMSNGITASWTYVTCCTTALQPLQVCHQVQNLLFHQILMIAWSLPYSGKTQRTDKHLNSQWEELWRSHATKERVSGGKPKLNWLVSCLGLSERASVNISSQTRVETVWGTEQSENVTWCKEQRLGLNMSAGLRAS